MPSVFIPQIGNIYKLIEEWKPMLEWESRNLVLLRKLGLTGMKPQNLGYSIVASDGTRVQATINRTVVNPLFITEDGSAVPITVTFPEDTLLEFSQLKVGYKNAIRHIWLKVIDCSDQRMINCVVSVSVDEIEGAELEFVREI